MEVEIGREVGDKREGAIDGLQGSIAVDLAVLRSVVGGIMKKSWRPAGADLSQGMRSQVEVDKRQVVNSHGFCAWVAFLDAERERQSRYGLHQNRPFGGPSFGEVAQHGALTQETDWADRITWSMLEEELSSMPTRKEDGAETDDDIREIELNVPKASKCLGQLRKLEPHLKAAWVELREVPPFLEDQAAEMLEAIGPVAYQTLDKQAKSRYADIPGCVMIDPSLELPAKVGIRTPWNKTYLQNVVFTRILDHCFICLGKGHWARNCPDKQKVADRRAGPRGQNGKTLQYEAAVAPQQSDPPQRGEPPDPVEGFKEVSSRSNARRAGNSKLDKDDMEVELLDKVYEVKGKKKVEDELQGWEEEPQLKEHTTTGWLERLNNVEGFEHIASPAVPTLSGFSFDSREETDMMNETGDPPETELLRQILGRAPKMKEQAREKTGDHNTDPQANGRAKERVFLPLRWVLWVYDKPFSGSRRY
ncbi:hypothetical protein R1sor_009225 [Riccia sorocarpa]|uniref:CCHC-type domain-containing protein n=1 Tax=Riccia sorocarpa TaxID=122646 RepID=A0ABD3H970_9MARC